MVFIGEESQLESFLFDLHAVLAGTVLYLGGDERFNNDEISRDCEKMYQQLCDILGMNHDSKDN